MTCNHDIESRVTFQIMVDISLTCADMTVPKYLSNMLIYLQ